MIQNKVRAPARYDVDTDGIDHINIDPRAKTELGRLLSHFTESPFTHPYLGKFNSMEGYWYYVKALVPDDYLRGLSERPAYLYGKALQQVRRRHFQDIIMDGNYQKIKENDHLRTLLIASTLPFSQYYQFGPNNITIHPPTAPWLVDEFEDLRDMFKKGEVLETVSYEMYQEVYTLKAV